MRVGEIGAVATLALVLSLLPEVSQADICQTGKPGQFGTTTYCASTVLKSQGRTNYKPMNASGDAKTAWVEGVPGNGVGQWLMIHWDSKACFQTIRIRNGYTRNKRTFVGNNRVRRAMLSTSDGWSMPIVLSDTTAVTKIRLPRIMKAHWIKLTIQSVYPGQKWKDTAISTFSADLEELNYDARCR